jgi:hypothetical protein
MLAVRSPAPILAAPTITRIKAIAFKLPWITTETLGVILF